MFAAVTKAPDFWWQYAIAFADIMIAVMFFIRAAGHDKNI
jgi:hypothetical protein